MADSPILKTVDLDSRTHLTNFDDIWYIRDMQWPSRSDWLLDIWNFENPDGEWLSSWKLKKHNFFTTSSDFDQGCYSK